MKINIYYGGRGMIGDPALYVVERMTKVFEELRVSVERFNLYEQKNNISALTGTLNSADGVVLASTVEWFGVGGFMTQFLDACWLYGNKEHIAKLYMLPVAMSTTYGERDGMTHLSTAWEILGGMPCDGVCGYIANTSVFEENTAYIDLIEKKAENFYRSINQKLPGLPNSNQAVNTRISTTKAPDLTPQENAMLSEYVSNEDYVQTQKEDISELASLFRSRLEKEEAVTEQRTDYTEKFRARFVPEKGVKCSYRLTFTDRPPEDAMELMVYGERCDCGKASSDGKYDVSISLTDEVMESIVSGRMTFQRAFMSGVMKIKGEFKLLRLLDQLFPFMEEE